MGIRSTLEYGNRGFSTRSGLPSSGGGGEGRGYFNFAGEAHCLQDIGKFDLVHSFRHWDGGRGTGTGGSTLIFLPFCPVYPRPTNIPVIWKLKPNSLRRRRRRGRGLVSRRCDGVWCGYECMHISRT